MSTLGELDTSRRDFLEAKTEGEIDSEGCRNTKFFHNVANHHMRINYMEDLEINGQVVKGKDNLREGVKSYTS